jgi:hypothetical protein
MSNNPRNPEDREGPKRHRIFAAAEDEHHRKVPRFAIAPADHDAAAAPRIVTPTKTSTTEYTRKPNSYSHLDLIPKLLMTDLRSNDETTVESALRQLILLIGAKPACRRSKSSELYTVGIGLILNAINKWSDPDTMYCDTKVPAVACELLARALQFQDKKQKDTVITLGGLETILQVTHALSDPMERAYGIFALTQLARGTETNMYPYLVTKLHGATAVCAAMRDPNQKEMVQKAGAMFLLGASKWADLRPALFKAGALSALSWAFENENTTSDEVRNYCKAALKNLVE